MKLFKTAIVSFLVLLTACMHTPQYPRGTVGYLTNSCSKAIQGNTLEDLMNNECYEFVAYYMTGFFGAAMKNHNPSPEHRFHAKDKSCEAVINKTDEELSEKTFCDNGYGGHLFFGVGYGPAFVISSFGEWLRFYDKDMLNKPVFPYINNAINSGPFCRYMRETKYRHVTVRPSKYMNDLSLERGNTTTEKDQKKSLYSINLGRMSPEQYHACMKDITKANGDSIKFMGTDCGIKIAAMWSGLFFTDVVEYVSPEEHRCAEDINRYYKYKILAKDSCLSKDMDLLAYTKSLEYSSSENLYLATDDSYSDLCESKREE